MSKVYNLTEAERLELYRVALTNARSNENIVKILAENGISEEFLNEGSSLLENAQQEFVTAKIRRKMRSEVHKEFSEKRAVLEEKFLDARKKADILFLNFVIAREKLELEKPYDRAYIRWIALVKNFYNELVENKNLAERMSKLGVSAEEIAATQTSIAEIEALRARYISEKGNAQDATDTKNQAMYTLSTWMTRFFNLAKNTFRNQPQLLESFDIVVKN